jgi:hypothetical protein
VTPAIWVGGVLYVLVAGRRRAAAPWAAAVVSSSIAFFPMVGDAEQRGSDASLGHMTDRVGDLFQVYAYIIRLDLPFDQLLDGPAGVVLLLASAVGIGLALERRDEAAEWARHWAAVALFAAVATAAGLAVFIPADDVFTPVWQGTDNRFSVAAAPGTAVLILALCCLVAIGLASLAGRARWAGLVAAALVGLTAAQMSTDLFDSRGEWEQAGVEQAKIIDAVEEAVGGRVKPGETVVIGHQLRVVPDGGPPVFVAPWDLDGALKLRYDDPTVSARVIESHAKCRASALTIDIASGPGAKSFPYDHLAFVDVSVPSATRVTGRKKCETAVRKLLE